MIIFIYSIYHNIFVKKKTMSDLKLNVVTREEKNGLKGKRSKQFGRSTKKKAYPTLL